MPKKDKRVDAYIANAQPFAQPILKHLRKLVHEACPDCEENIKWSFVTFDYKGILCNMASFKQHVAFGFWKGKLIKDPKGYLQLDKEAANNAMGNLGRITDLKDLPADKVIIDFIQQAVKLNDENIKVPAKPKASAKPAKLPDYFESALKKNKKVWQNFEAFSPSQQKEYITWITDAKTLATREKRMADAVEWIAAKKPRNWKYMKK
ncbi:MAG TPA: YdeI/OmpD-associated family protein [Cyclobacteriaceae bacterium]|nr:YdeI/OmpD-associated family protein [Cyclobacteriaceae bacterium]